MLFIYFVSLTFSSQVASMRGVARPVGKLPASNQPPNVMLSKELVSPSDIKFVSQSVSLSLSLSPPPLLLLLLLYCFLPLLHHTLCVPLLIIDIRSYRSSQPCREQYGDKERRTSGSTVFSSLNKTRGFHLYVYKFILLLYLKVMIGKKWSHPTPL